MFDDFKTLTFLQVEVILISIITLASLILLEIFVRKREELLGVLVEISLSTLCCKQSTNFHSQTWLLFFDQ